MRLIYQCLTFLLLFTFSCKQSSKRQLLIKLDEINIMPENNDVKLSSLFENGEFIRLEATGPNQLIKSIEQFKICKDYIFIKTNQSILTYSLEGKCVSQITKRGKGPGEYNRITDFYVDPELKYVEVNDFDQKKVIKYSFKGDYIDEWKHDLIANKFTKFDENNYTFYCSSFINELSDNRLIFLKKGNRNPYNHYFKISSNEAWYLYIIDYTNFVTFNNQAYFLFSQNDTVYSISETGIKPKILINFLDKKIPTKMYTQKFDNIFLFMQELKKSNYAGIIDNFHESENYMTFTFLYQNLLYQALYNKKTRNSLVIKLLIDDINFTDQKFDINFSFRPLEIYDDAIYYSIEPQEIIKIFDNFKNSNPKIGEEFKSNHPQLVNLYDSISVLDNPIIYKLNFK